MKKHVANFLTICNMLSGILGIVLVFEDKLIWAAIMIWLGGLFDFLDGFFARLLNVKSLIGKELDSLSDMITFGLLPSLIVFSYLYEFDHYLFIPYLAFMIAIFSALRLAKFNIDDRQTDSFLGLPTPASALVVSSIPFYAESEKFSFLVNTYSLIAIVIILSLLMVTEIPLFSFKIKGISWVKDKWKLMFVTLTLILILLLNVLSFPLIIIFYLVFSVLDNKKKEKLVE